MATQQETTAPVDSAERPATGIALAAAGLLWMAALVWSARSSITARGDAATEVTSTAYALPGLITASLVGGASAALAVRAAVGRLCPLGATLRFAVATGTGLVVGLPAAVALLTINTDGWVYAVAGGTVAAAATIGGAFGGFRTARVVAAACWAAIAVFLVGFVLNYLPVLSLFGGRDSSSWTGAAGWFGLTQAGLSGLAAGLVAYLVLRHARRRTGDDLGWPWYALAGAGPGLLLILAEGLARTAGARVFDLAGRVSQLELTVQRMLGGSRLNSALIVLFVGAVTAILAVGRTLGPPAEDAD
jgi:hypothetical protein